MSGLRLDIDLDKIGENARHLVEVAGRRGVSVTAVTKALLGEPRLARTLVDAGVAAIGDSRIENIERMRHAHITAPMLLLRSPMPSQVDRVVRSNTVSVNSELDVLSALASAAQLCGRIHPVMIMVELGDLRDGVMPSDLHATVRHVLRRPSLSLQGIGTNLACRNGVEPTDENMGELTRLVDGVESTFGVEISTVSGGNSANLEWLEDTTDIGRVNDLRLGEAILLGRNPLDRSAVPGLHTDAILLACEVIESQRKPRQPWGRARQSAFGVIREPAVSDADHGDIWQTIVAAGRQDIEPDDMSSASNIRILGASSDHLMLETDSRRSPGSEIFFEPGYGALLRSATSPFVGKRFREVAEPSRTVSVSSRTRAPSPAKERSSGRPKLALVPKSLTAPPPGGSMAVAD